MSYSGSLRTSSRPSNLGAPDDLRTSSPRSAPSDPEPVDDPLADPLASPEDEDAELRRELAEARVMVALGPQPSGPLELRALLTEAQNQGSDVEALYQRFLARRPADWSPAPGWEEVAPDGSAPSPTSAEPLAGSAATDPLAASPSDLEGLEPAPEPLEEPALPEPEPVAPVGRPEPREALRRAVAAGNRGRRPSTRASSPGPSSPNSSPSGAY